MANSGTKNANKARILGLIREEMAISRAEMAKLTGLTRPTVSSLVSELINKGLVEETGKGESSGGKRPIMLRIVPDSVYAIGIDLADENFIRGVLCNFAGKLIKKDRILHDNSFEDLRNKLPLMINHLRGEISLSGKISGIGVAVSGIVDQEKNEVIACSNYDVVGRGIAREIANQNGLPVILENRPNAAAFGEHLYGVGRDHRSLVYLTSGRGVGAGIIDRGKIFPGCSGCAGELANLLVAGNNDLNSYHVESTVEYRASEKYLVGAASHLKGRKLSYQEILELYQRQDADIEKILNENADYLAYTGSVIANIINPEVLVLGGQMAEFGETYLSRFRKTFRNHLSAPDLNRTEVLVSKFGRDGVAFGGAAIIIDKIANFALDKGE